MILSITRAVIGIATYFSAASPALPLCLDFFNVEFDAGDGLLTVDLAAFVRENFRPHGHRLASVARFACSVLQDLKHVRGWKGSALAGQRG